MTKGTDNIVEELEFIFKHIGEDKDIRLKSVSGDTRLEQDIENALHSIEMHNMDLADEIYELEDELEESKAENKVMLKHIKKLERMLEKRNVKFKGIEEEIGTF